MSQVCPLTQLLEASHAEYDPYLPEHAEALDRLAKYAIAHLVAKGHLTEAEAEGAYFEEAMDDTLNLRVPAWDTSEDDSDGWLQWTKGEEPIRV
jgi:hypothetical protein